MELQVGFVLEKSFYRQVKISSTVSYISRHKLAKIIKRENIKLSIG